MDFDGAIAAHVAWKTKLGRYLRNPDKSLKAADIAVDHQCALGQWLYGEGKKYLSDPDFLELKKQHATFHREAADLVKRADLGEKVAEEAGLGASSPYGKASTQVVQSIVKMKLKVK